jgi:DNA mismatch repair ATPase MutS
MSGKNSPLEKILEIDKEISQIKNDTTYMKIRNGLKKIKKGYHGNRYISIPSPRDVRKEIRIRRRSKEMKSVKRMYEKRLSAFEAKISSLLRERNTLEVQIFG